MPRYALLILALALAAPISAYAADAEIRQIEIKSSWGGLGIPQHVELLVRSDEGGYRLGDTRIESATVQSLGVAIRQTTQTKPTVKSLGLTQEWLENAAERLEREAEHDGDDSTLYKLGQGSSDQRAIFRQAYTDPKFVGKVLADLFRCCHTDDNPGVKVTVLYADGNRAVLSSHSQSQFMLPWTIEVGGTSVETSNKSVSVAVAALMPENATNRDRISGEGLGLALGWVVMSAIESDWNLSNVKAHGSAALGEIGNVYKIVDADINPYHDVTFGVYVKDSRVEGEENLHVQLRRKDFPPGFAVTAILLYKDGKVLGVDEFLKDNSRYEDLVLAVPWLARLRAKSPRAGPSLLWVHDKSLSDKAMQNFAADMHVLGKDALVKEVRQEQSQVAVLNVSYGDWWLVLPDRRMILWRYESVAGLLGWKQSEFRAHEYTDYQGVTGGCIGAVFSPEGELID